MRQHNSQGAKGHYFKQHFQRKEYFELDNNLESKPKSLMSDDEIVRDFQRKIYQKAKQEKSFKFYILYDKICNERFLREAYRRVKKNKGVCGVDNISFEQIEYLGLDKYLAEIQTELKDKSYKPSPVLRVYIPKANGKMRPLGIPTIKDRIVQMACKMVIEPIFEADFEDTSYGFRPKRSAKDAMATIKKNLQEGNIEILDADLSAYFDTIPHDKLMILVGQRISDKYVLGLIKLWLKSPVMENGRMTGGKKNKKGTPQGGVISPLLANIYLHLMDKLINKEGSLFHRKGVRIVRYADDFVLMAKRLTKEIYHKLENILNRMELVINRDKTHVVNAKENSFDFLGFTIRYDKDIFGSDKRYWNIIPSKKSEKKVRENIRNYLKSHIHYSPRNVAKDLNLIIRGWVNYFWIPKVSYPQKAKRVLRRYLETTLWRYYKRKSQRRCKLYRQNAMEVLIKKYGLINPSDRMLFEMPIVNAFR